MYSNYVAFNNSSLPWLVALPRIIEVADRLAGKGRNQIISEETCELYLRSNYASHIKHDFQMTFRVCTCFQM